MSSEMENNPSDNGIKILKYLLKRTSVTCPQWQDESASEASRFKSNQEIFEQLNKLISNLGEFYNNHEIEIDEIDGDEKIPFDIVRNDILGRHLVSTRDIKVGEVLLVEKCIISGPIVYIPYGNDIPVCVQCFSKAGRYLCSKCGFFLCQKDDCKKIHISGPECLLLSKLNLAKDQVGIHKMEEKDCESILQNLPQGDSIEKCQNTSDDYLKLIYDQTPKILKYYPALPTLKTLCMIEKSKMAERIILSLQGDVIPESRRYKVNQIHIVNIIKLMTNSYTEETIHRISSIWDTNAFQSTEKERKIQILFALSSFFTHSCKANSENFLLKGSDTMIIRAVEFIPKNSILTINYADPLWPTYIRRDHLRISKNFWCKCDRCEDSSEYGTFMGHIACDSCSKLTLSISNTNNCNTLTCNNCKTETKYSKVLQTEATICNLLSNMRIVDFETYEKIPSKIEAIFGKKFHEGHHIMWKIRYSYVVDHAKQNLSDIEDEKLLKIASLVHDLYKFCSSVLPTFSKKKALVSKELLRYSEEMMRRFGKPFLDDKDKQIIEEESKLPLHW